MNMVASTVIVLLVATVASLAWGVYSMSQGGVYDRDHSEKLMVARVGLQAAAIVLLLLAVFFSLF
jgi:hypothetical protein